MKLTHFPSFGYFLTILNKADNNILGQCKVAKVKHIGKKPCRRCGTQLEAASSQYYYGSCRFHARHTCAKRTTEESLPPMTLADEEGAAWKRVSRDSGFSGVSKLVNFL